MEPSPDQVKTILARDLQSTLRKCGGGHMVTFVLTGASSGSLRQQASPAFHSPQARRNGSKIARFGSQIDHLNRHTELVPEHIFVSTINKL